MKDSGMDIGKGAARALAEALGSMAGVIKAALEEMPTLELTQESEARLMAEERNPLNPDRDLPVCRQYVAMKFALNSVGGSLWNFRNHLIDGL